jgi:SAM-dependent methyltransferase
MTESARYPHDSKPDTIEHDYVLGTNDEELERLGLQHRVWRPRALRAWQRAGFTLGQTIVDAGCGPGYAAMDLAEIVGSGGHIVAIDRSRRFLQALSANAKMRSITNIETIECDLDGIGDSLPAVNADGVWCRWVLSFVTRPQRVLSALVNALRPGGTLVMHEYFDYGSWRFAPRSLLLEEFVAAVMQSWRDHGGEPDIALQLPTWLMDLDVDIVSMQPIIDVVPRTNHIWEWPSAFIESGLDRLLELGMMSQEKTTELRAELQRLSLTRGTLMITPGVMEIVARRKFTRSELPTSD